MLGGQIILCETSGKSHDIFYLSRPTELYNTKRKCFGKLQTLVNSNVSILVHKLPPIIPQPYKQLIMGEIMLGGGPRRGKRGTLYSVQFPFKPKTALNIQFSKQNLYSNADYTVVSTIKVSTSRSCLSLFRWKARCCCGKSRKKNQLDLPSYTTVFTIQVIFGKM